MANKNQIKVGDKVKLTGKFLKSTGQQKGGEGQSVWIVTALTNGDRWAVTNQELSAEALTSFTAEELAADPSLKFRRIALANLCRVGQVTADNCP